jgi:hypothetical protein
MGGPAPRDADGAQKLAAGTRIVPRIESAAPDRTGIFREYGDRARLAVASHVAQLSSPPTTYPISVHPRETARH